MKKICILFITIGLFISPQIVKATDLFDATLKQKGTQNEASTMAWLSSASPNASIINMPLNSFNTEFKNSLSMFNDKYGTFSVIDGDIINDEIVPNLYTADLDPKKLYRFSWYDSKTGKWGAWNRLPKAGETGLFYQGWEEPILSVYCWNFGYPLDNNKVFKPKAPVFKETETEYVYIPGKKKVITYGPDTLETNRSSVEIERNDVKFASYKNNTRYEVSMDKEERSYSKNSSCDCPDKEEKRYAREPRCGCDDEHICRDHYEKLPTKVKKKFFNTFGGKAVIFAGGAVLGAFLHNNIRLGKGRNNNDYGWVTQGPLDPLPSTNPIYTQAGVIPL